MTGRDVYRDVLTLSSGTQQTLLREAGCTEPLTVDQIEDAMLNFAEWCLDEDGGPFDSWMDAWERFLRAGAPGMDFALTGKPA